MTNLANWFLYFLIYSIFGWVAEVVLCSIYNRKKMSRGFLFGPYCPIYGTGAVLILVATYRVSNDPTLTFLISMLVCSALEYFTSLVMEKIYHIRWWDYRGSDPLNLNGRICLRNSLVFGIGGCAIVFWGQPIVDGIVQWIPETIRVVVAIISAVILLLDTVASSYAANKASKTMDFAKVIGDQSNEIKKACRQAIKNFVKKSNKKSPKTGK